MFVVALFRRIVMVVSQNWGTLMGSGFLLWRREKATERERECKTNETFLLPNFPTQLTPFLK